MIFRTKPQYLLAVPKKEEWEAAVVFKRIYKIDYDITSKHMQGYWLVESDDRSVKPVIVITLQGAWKNPSYRWYRPNIDAIIQEGNMGLLLELFTQDVARHV